MQFKRIQFLFTISLVGCFVMLASLTSNVVAQSDAASILADFEGETAPPGFFVFNGGASSVTTTPINVPDSDALARPEQVGDNDILSVDFSVGDFGGFGGSYETIGGPDDWSAFSSFNFWFYGTGSGLTYQAELSENRSDPNVDTSERWDYAFTDNTAGWQLISIPFADFTRATDFQPGGAPDDGLTLTEVWAWAFVLPGGADTFYLDDVYLDVETSSGGAVVFDDMEHGDPINNGWFSFATGTSGGGIDPNFTDLPPENGGAASLQTGWGGVPGFYGGFGRENPVDLTGTNTFSFWINPDAGQDYTIEINLQDDDNNDGLIDQANDDEFQYNCVVSAAGPCAISGGGWQLVSIPLSDFFDDGSFFFGGNGTLDATPDNGQLINVVFAIIGTGTNVNFRTDYWTFSQEDDTTTPTPAQIVDDFEDGLPVGVDPNGIPLGFFTFSDGSPNFIELTDTPPAAVPDSAADNTVLAMTGDVQSFAGFVHAFENEAVDTWVTQDWSGFEGMSFWFYGQNSNTTVFIDVIDNRPLGSTQDNAERYTVSFVDDFSGWQYFEFPFSQFTFKSINNGAVNDGFTLTQIHGYAFGTLNTPGSITHYIDDVSLYGEAVIPDLAVTFATSETEIEEGTTGDVTVKLNRPLNSEDPAQVSVDYFTEEVGAIAGRDYASTSGTLTFVNGGPSELTFPITTFDDTKWEGTERVILRLANPVDVTFGFFTQAAAAIVDNDAFDPNIIDDFEYGAFQWEGSELATLSAVELAQGDPLARPNQDAVETALQISMISGESPRAMIEEALVSVEGLDTDNRKVDRALRNAKKWLERSLNDQYWANDYYLDDHRGLLVYNRLYLAIRELTYAAPRSGALQPMIEEIIEQLVDANQSVAQIEIDLAVASNANGYKIDFAEELMSRGDTALDKGRTLRAVRNYRRAWFVANVALRQVTPAAATANRDFPIGQDWSNGEALTFWYYGSGSGEDVTVNLKDNRAADPGPAGWDLVWSEEFNEAAGTPPNPEYWTYEIGDGTVNGIPGWGNDEFQYYTDDLANAATDGNGNMVMTVLEGDGSLECYYGPCDYTSARLISWRKAEFAYGRIESRILVPDGGSGIWPAFWSLGTDIDVVQWPQTGEIDFMEYVSRLPNEIFGTIHGPGYAGGDSYGNKYFFNEPVYNNYHTFTTVWQPNYIEWYVDGILYHTATPEDVAPNEWVFNDPVFLLLNIAMGGNFGGNIDSNIQFPQSMAIDYIRVYQGPDTAERFEATFTDDFEGWQQVEVPFAAFARSADQPAGAPDDGLTLSEVWGYGFTLPSGGTTWIDLAEVKPLPAPDEVTVTMASASAIQQAIEDVADGGTVIIDPSLANSTIVLNGPIVLNKSVTIDAAGLNITLDGGGGDRVLIVDLGVEATVKGMILTNGYGFQLGGGVLNNGSLTLEGVVVTGNTMTTPDVDQFWQGGGGIYSGDGASLTLIDSTVASNSSGWTGGGIYSFFNTTTTLIRTTVNNNVAADIAGGLRILGDATITDSTIVGNVSTTWHGGGLFMTDGTISIVGSTITGNVAPDGTAGGLMVATFGAPVSVSVQNSNVTNNGSYNCQVEGDPAVAVLTSLGGNTFSDPSCNPIGSDTVLP